MPPLLNFQQQLSAARRVSSFFQVNKCSSFHLNLWEGTQLLYCIRHDELTSPTLHILSDFVPQRVTAEDALKVTGLQQIVV